LHANLAGTVLVVDDELDILEVAAAYLTEMGLTVIQARDGAEALKMIGEHSEIDLIVTDIVMAGGMNGEDLVRKVRVSQPDLKVIYSSGFPAEVLAKRTMQLVEGPLLRKPYQRADFSAIVHRVMESGNSVAPEFEDSLSVRGVQRKS
jgi:DNA-binding NtrC family response regulator